MKKTKSILETDSELKGMDHTMYRALAARANYLALDRPDIQFATKEICRAMSNPTKSDWLKLKRLGRFLIDAKRLVAKYPWQATEDHLKGYSDSDWAGCAKTAKSTSGGAIMLGRHWLKSWSSTQKTVALRSGEAELTAIVKMSTEMIGVLNMMLDWKAQYGARSFADSTAALGVVNRKGSGKLRHVRVGMLWVQGKREDGTLEYTKVGGEDNPGDLMTKHLGSDVLRRHIARLNLEMRGGRANDGLQLSSLMKVKSKRRKRG